MLHHPILLLPHVEPVEPMMITGIIKEMMATHPLMITVAVAQDTKIVTVVVDTALPHHLLQDPLDSRMSTVPVVVIDQVIVALVIRTTTNMIQHPSILVVIHYLHLVVVVGYHLKTIIDHILGVPRDQEGKIAVTGDIHQEVVAVII